MHTSLVCGMPAARPSPSIRSSGTTNDRCVSYQVRISPLGGSDDRAYPADWRDTLLPGPSSHLLAESNGLAADDAQTTLQPGPRGGATAAGGPSRERGKVIPRPCMGPRFAGPLAAVYRTSARRYHPGC